MAHLPPLDADRLLAFLTVAEEQGFSRAAARLGKTQSSVSQAVALLEEELGQRLFLRAGRVTRPTDAGRALRPHAERILVEMAAARARLQAVGELRAGELVIGTSDTLACHLLPAVFAAFRARHPKIELRLENCPSPETARRVAERAVDLGVVTLPLPEELRAGGQPLDEQIRTERLAPQEDVAIAPPGHPIAGRRSIPLTTLARFPLLLLDRSTASRAFLDARLAAQGLRPHVAMEMGSVEVLKRLVELGFGVSVVPALAVERERAAGTVVATRIQGFGRARQVAAVLPVPGPPSRAAAAFVALARTTLGGGTPPGGGSTPQVGGRTPRSAGDERPSRPSNPRLSSRQR